MGTATIRLGIKYRLLMLPVGKGERGRGACSLWLVALSPAAAYRMASMPAESTHMGGSEGVYRAIIWISPPLR